MTANTTNRAYTYPQSGDHVRLWEHFQELAEDIDGDINTNLMSAWTAWTPTFTAGSGSPAFGNSVVTARYRRIGKTVHAACRIVWGSTANFGGAGWNLSLPVTARSTEALFRVGQAYFRDTSATSAGHFTGICLIDTTNPDRVQFFNVNAQVGNTLPFTWVQTDHLAFNLTYEAA